MVTLKLLLQRIINETNRRNGATDAQHSLIVDLDNINEHADQALELINNEVFFEFKYNSDTYEGGATTISIHRTKKGAEMALDFHKDKVKKEHDDLYSIDPEDKPLYNYDKWWGVEETEVID